MDRSVIYKKRPSVIEGLDQLFIVDMNHWIRNHFVFL